MWALAHSICLPVPEAASLPTVCSDIELLAQSRSKVIHEKFCLHGRLTEAYLHSLSGTTLQPSELTTQIHEATSSGCEKGAGNSSFVAGSRSCARTLVRPDQEKDWMGKEVGFGRKWLGLLAKFDHASSLWKTAQCSLVEGLDEFSATWPRWGSMRTGVCWERMTAVESIYESESGYWPTPNCQGYRSDGELLMLSRKCESYLEYRSMSDRACASKRDKFWAPEQCDSMRLSLNWSEKLMGWPIGQTELKPLGMDKMHAWQQQHGGF